MAIAGNKGKSHVPSLFQPARQPPSRQRGFTLVELLITMLVALIAVGGVYTVYASQQRDYRNQQLVLEAQQNMRGAMIILEQQIRMAGYDPESTNRFGITDIRRYDPLENKADPLGEPALAYTADLDEDGELNPGDGLRSVEHPNLRIHRDEDLGRTYLAWNTGQGPQPLAENIQALGFAYAIDVGQDGRPDRWANGEHTIWAVDENNDNLLDTHIDANDDGIIDMRDDTNGDNRITSADGAPLNPPVALEHIKAVRVWVLSTSARPLQGYYDNRPHVVGDRIIPAGQDGFQRNVLQSIIDCRNL